MNLAKRAHRNCFGDSSLPCNPAEYYRARQNREFGVCKHRGALNMSFNNVYPMDIRKELYPSTSNV